MYRIFRKPNNANQNKDNSEEKNLHKRYSQSLNWFSRVPEHIPVLLWTKAFLQKRKRKITPAKEDPITSSESTTIII